MNPAFSVVFFTTLAGAAQGLVVALALAVLGGVPMRPGLRRRRARSSPALLLVAGLGGVVPATSGGRSGPGARR